MRVDVHDDLMMIRGRRTVTTLTAVEIGARYGDQRIGLLRTPGRSLVHRNVGSDVHCHLARRHGAVERARGIDNSRRK